MRVLFVHAGEMSSFVRQDFELLSRHAEVTPHRWEGPRDAPTLLRALGAHDAGFSWFLGHHAAAMALLGRAARRPTIAVLGGVEPAAPDVTGSTPSRRDRWAVRTAYNRSGLVLAVSRFTLEEALALRRPGAVSEVRVVPNGVDTRRFAPEGPKEDLVLTVGIVERTSAHRKRMALFAQAARLVPEARWVLAGAHVDGTAQELARGAPPNLEMPGEVSPEELLRLYRAARVYVQPSLHESFGMANAEAMACGAVPVVARAGALPEVVGDAGLLLPEPPSAEDLAGAVRKALGSDLGPRARQRIVERYPLQARERGLARAVHDAVEGRLRPGIRAPEGP